MVHVISRRWISQNPTLGATYIEIFAKLFKQAQFPLPVAQTRLDNPQITRNVYSTHQVSANKPISTPTSHLSANQNPANFSTPTTEP